MSDSSKRPGTSRDISELKARLGLKKGGAPAPAAKNGGQGVVPPPGVSLPAPPGVAPAGPVVPSAKDDPFGAMNAMAQIGTMQRAPDALSIAPSATSSTTRSSTSARASARARSSSTS